MRRQYETHGSPSVPSPASSPRVLLFGLRCRFTETVLRRLLERKVGVVGTVIPGPPGLDHPLRIDPPHSGLPIAAEAGLPPLNQLPLHHIGSLTHPATTRLVESLEPDFIAVACFPQRIPSQLADVTRVAALNVHPSMLPENRGPDPLFWAFKRGDGRFGVSVHAIKGRLDAGDIVEQQEFTGWDGIAEAEAEARLAECGADLVASAIDALMSGQSTQTPQNETLASYESWPSDDDYRIDVARPARNAFNFVRGIKDRGVPIHVSIAGERVRVIDALAFDDDDCPRFEPAAGDVVHIPCTPGTLVAKIDVSPGRRPSG